MNNLPMRDRVCLVTGASRGIGRDIAIYLSELGSDIAFCYRKENDVVKSLHAEIESMGRRVLAIQADVSKEEDVERIFKEVDAYFGKLDVLVNNAGQTRDGLLATMSLDDMLAVINGNLISTMLCSREASKVMMSQKHGSIINISSISATQANRGQTNYAASKGGVEAFTRALAVELASRKVRVNAVAPGVIETEMTSQLLEQQDGRLKSRILSKRLGRSRDISLAVAYLAHPENEYVTGEILHVNGGLTLS